MDRAIDWCSMDSGDCRIYVLPGSRHVLYSEGERWGRKPNRRVVKGSGEGDSGVWRVFGGQANQMTKLARAGGRWTDVQKDADSAECE